MTLSVWFFFGIKLGIGSLFEDSSETAHFSHKGDLVLISEHADIIIDVDLAEIHQTISDSCAIARHFNSNNSNILGLVKGKFADLCSQQREAWKATEDILTASNTVETTATGRQPRFLVTAVVTSILAGAAGALWGEVQGRQDLTRLEEAHDKLVTVLNQEEARSGINEHHIRDLAQIMSSTAAHRILSSLEMAASQQKLSIHLLRAGNLVDRIGRLQDKQQGRGLQLTATTDTAVLQHRVSFGMFSSQTARIVLHLPIYRTRDFFHLWEYLPIPFRMSGTNTFGQVLPGERTQIAVSRTGDRSFVLDVTKEPGCYLHQVWHCTSSHVPVYRKPEPGCIQALKAGDKVNLVRYCNVWTPPTAPTLWTTNSQQVFLYHPWEETATISCAGSTKESRSFKGTMGITLEGGCTISNSYLSLLQAKRVPTRTVVLRAPLAQPLTESLNLWDKSGPAHDEAVSRELH